ncbi:hypothetical protein SAMN04488067_11191 [Halorubrum xinjiangense]|jgi:hypothetical protein|uniref:Uncharacterized protein n=1 Tax=Halorubrum xinjiangense TaxID=261291 RepID=A0A1G7Q916_9EURY|nr:hypothetical protein [Halorubrum xinjiangense]SDF95031.1 hypothetical protein SAMN04488067_11191 [Halorubrum xinjiangense]
MEEETVNRLITDEVEKIDDSERKQFIRSVLSHERKHIDLENFGYKSEYKDMIKEATGTED